MPKLTQLLKTRRFTVLAFSVAVLGILAGVVWTSRAQRQKLPSPIVTSRISAIQVVSAEPTSIGTSNVLVVKLQNTSGKEIKAYTIASGKALMTSNYFLTEESFSPGTTIDKVLPLTFSDANYQVPMSGKEVTVAAVFFADGTGDGLSQYVSSMADLYAGTREQAKRILPCLQRLSLTSEFLAACEAEARNLPVKENGKSSDYESGLEFARDNVLRQLDEIKGKTGANLPKATDKQEKLTKVFKDLAENSKKSN